MLPNCKRPLPAADLPEPHRGNTPLERPDSPRSRFLRIVQQQPVDRGFAWAEQPWTEARQRWLAEGMPADQCLGRDGAYHGHAMGVELGYCPPWQTGPVLDEGDTQLVCDEYGIIKRVWKNKSGMPQFVSFPVANRADWLQVKPRLAPDAPGRLTPDWPRDVADRGRTGSPIMFGGTHLCGFFSFLRELVGDEVYYLFHDEPALAEEMLEFQADRLSAMVKLACEAQRVDVVFVWEDMCFRNGPLIGPDMFRRFILPPLKRYLQVVRACGVPVVDLDSDGNVESLIPLWIEAGVNLLHPMEVAAGMDVVKIRRQYGRDLSLRGGIDKRALARDRAAIDRELARIAPAVDSSGYIPHVDHSVPPDVSWSNFAYYLQQRERLLGC